MRGCCSQLEAWLCWWWFSLFPHLVLGQPSRQLHSHFSLCTELGCPHIRHCEYRSEGESRLLPRETSACSHASPAVQQLLFPGVCSQALSLGRSIDRTLEATATSCPACFPEHLVPSDILVELIVFCLPRKQVEGGQGFCSFILCYVPEHDKYSLNIY